MEKKYFLLLILILFVSCKKESQIVVNNFNENVIYSNIDSIDIIPKNLYQKFFQIEMRGFDALEISEKENLVKLEGNDFLYIVHHIFVSTQEYFRDKLGEKYVDYNESLYRKNTELYACGKFEVEKGIMTFLVLEISTDEIFKNKNKSLYLLNVEKEKLRSIIKISNFYNIAPGQHLKAYRANALFYISDLEFREDLVYQFMPKEIRSKLKIQKGSAKILDYAKFAIEDKGRICLKSI